MKHRILMDFVDMVGLERSQNEFLPLLNQRWEIIPSEYPDYLCFTHEGQRHKLYSCTKIFYTQENYLPDWRECDFAILARKLDDPRVFHLPYYSFGRDASLLVREPDQDWRGMLKSKAGFCSFVVGYDDRTVRYRSSFFKKLNARKPVDSGGKGLNNIGRTILPGITPKLEFLRHYRFHLAFENSQVPGYATEKIVDGFAANAVPIYWGDATIKDQFNPAAFIDRSDFPSDEACIEHILKVDADDELYLKYLSAPPFHGNQPNKEWNHERLLDFFSQIFSTPPNPIAQRRWFSKLTKWRLARRNKSHRERGLPTAEERYQARQQLNASAKNL